MKRKHLFLAIVALLVAGGWWFARTAWRSHGSQQASTSVGFETSDRTSGDSKSATALAKTSQTGAAPGSNNRSKSGPMVNPPVRLVPPVPNRRFTDFTPEQRVEFARKGRGPGG